MAEIKRRLEQMDRGEVELKDAFAALEDLRRQLRAERTAMKLAKHPGMMRSSTAHLRDDGPSGRTFGDESCDAPQRGIWSLRTNREVFGRVTVPVASHEVRRFVIKRFPYSIYYDMRAQDVVVFAVCASTSPAALAIRLQRLH